MKKFLAALLVPALLASAVAFAADPNLEGVKCLMNPKAAAKADKSVSYKGGKVFFCCDNCPKKFDAEKNATAANHQLVQSGQAKQAKCPLSGGDLNADTKIKVAGAEVAFCCNMCKGKVMEAKGDAQIDMVFSNKAFEKAGFKVGK
jgi:YHS domain-containing protein